MSVLGVIPPETGFMPSRLNSPFVSLPSPVQSRNGACHDCWLPALGGSVMSYHRTKHKPLFLGSWVKRGWPAKGQTGIFLSSTVWLMLWQSKLLSSGAKRQVLMHKLELIRQ